MLHGEKNLQWTVPLNAFKNKRQCEYLLTFVSSDLSRQQHSHQVWSLTHTPLQINNTVTPTQVEIMQYTKYVCVSVCMYTCLSESHISFAVWANKCYQKKKVSLLRGPKRAHPAEGDRHTGQLAN